MLNFQRIITILAAVTMTACGTTTSSDGDATGDATTDDAMTGSDTASDAMGDASGPVYSWVVIYDSEKPDCTTNGPGADIDSVQLISGGSVIGAGMSGSSNYAASNPNNVGTCTMCGAAGDKACTHAGDKCSCADAAMGPPDAKLYCGATVDTGYISLNGGSLEFQIGDPTGAGPAFTFQSGDHIKVWEVDETFTHVDNETCAKPLSEKYEVWLRTAKGLDTGSIKLTAAGGADGDGTTEFVVP